MATIEQSLYSHLTGHAGLSALVATRVYPVKLPQNPTYPAVAYSRVSRRAIFVRPAVRQISSPRFQFSILGAHYDDVRDVATQLKIAVLAFRTSEDPFVYYVELENEQDLFEPAVDPGVGIYRTDIDALLFMQECV